MTAPPQRFRRAVVPSTELGRTVEDNHSKHTATAPASVHPALVAAQYVRDHVNGLTATVKSVALAIAVNTELDGRTHISVRELAEQTGYDAECLARSVKALEAYGFLTVWRPGGRRPNVYELSTALHLRAVKPSTSARTVRAQPSTSARTVRALALCSNNNSLQGELKKEQQQPPLREHAVAALADLDSHIDELAQNPARRKSLAVYRFGIRRNIAADLAVLQDRYETAAELVAAIVGKAPPARELMADLEPEPLERVELPAEGWRAYVAESPVNT